MKKHQYVLIILCLALLLYSHNMSSPRIDPSESKLEKSAEQTWTECIEDIQGSIISKLSDKLTDPELKKYPLILVDPAYHSNVGDTLISYGELVLMERMGFMNHTECHIAQSQGRSKPCGDFSQFSDGGLVFWQGSGGWGDLWDREMITLRRPITFVQMMNKNKTVISMPSSLFYANKTLETSDAKLWMDNIAKNANLAKSKNKIILTWRQDDSFKKGSSLYNLVNNRLVADAAFMIGPLEGREEWRKEMKKVDFLFLLRTDKESKYKSERNLKSLRTLLDSMDDSRGLSFHLVDWWDMDKFYNSSSTQPGPQFKQKVKLEGNFNYKPMFRSSIAMLSSGKVLITDRLHSSILAFLLHKPHVYLDQMYGKITKTRQVAFEASSNCENRTILKFDQAVTVKEAVQKAVKMLEVLEELND